MMELFELWGLSSHARWLRLMVSLFLAALAQDRTRPEKPVLLMLDEFAALSRLQMVETAMGLMRGYGVKLWPIGLRMLETQLFPRDFSTANSETKDHLATASTVLPRNNIARVNLC